MIYIILILAIPVAAGIGFRLHRKKKGYIHFAKGYITYEGETKISTLYLYPSMLTINDMQSISVETITKVSSNYDIVIEFKDNDGIKKKLVFSPLQSKGFYYDIFLVMKEKINGQIENIQQKTVNHNSPKEIKMRNTESSEKKNIFVITNQKFQNVRQEILSKKVWCTYELGTLYPAKDYSFGNYPSYFIFVDGFLFSITSYSEDMKVYFYRRNKVEILNENFFSEGKNYILKINHFSKYVLDEGMKSVIEDYYKSFSEKYEPLFIEEVDALINRILSNPENKLLLTNFLAVYGESMFSNIPHVNHLEEVFLSQLFCRDRNDDGYRNMTFSFNSPYQKLIDLFENKKLLEVPDVLIKHDIFENRNIEMYYDYLFTRCLKSLSVKHFASSFEKMYGGYFLDIGNLSLDNCIKNYFDIDTVEHRRIDSVSQLVYYLYENNSNVRNIYSNSIYDAYRVIKEKIVEYIKNMQLSNFEKELMMHNIEDVSENALDKITIHDVDLFSGIEFENFIAYLFKKMGYMVTLTKASGDQGIDLIVEKKGLRLGVQAKCYSSKVSNKAIQEVSAGINHYKLTKGLVVTNNYFTQSARELAETNDVLLWDREILNEKIKDALNESASK